MEALSHTNLVGLLGVMVPIVGIIAPVVLVIALMYFRHARTLKLYETVKHLAEKGQPIPPELLASEVREDGHGGDGSRGPTTPLTLIGAGIGVGIFFWNWAPMVRFWGLGALIALVGLGQLVAWWIGRRPSRAAKAPAGGG